MKSFITSLLLFPQPFTIPLHFLLGILSICFHSSYASEEIFDQSFEEHFENTVLPFYWSAPSGTLHRPNQVDLHYKTFDNPISKGTIVFVTGWTETHLKYAELIWEFYQNGYSIYSIDNRGMGFSTRLTSNPQQVHVENVQDYVDDLKEFVDKVVRPANPIKLYFVAHSMGGLITAEYLARFPDDAQAAVFSAPLFELNTGSLPEYLAYQITKTEIKRGKGKHYAMTQGDTTYEKASDFSTQKTTHSLKRWKKKIANWKHFPILLQGGSTNQWVNSVLKHTFLLLEKGWKTMKTPTLILQASHDTYVINRGHQRVCSQAQHCQIKQYPNSYHELFLEHEPVRSPAITDTLQFLEHY